MDRSSISRTGETETGGYFCHLFREYQGLDSPFSNYTGEVAAVKAVINKLKKKNSRFLLKLLDTQAVIQYLSSKNQTGCKRAPDLKRT